MRLNICTLILTVSVLIGVAAFPVSAFGANYNWVGGTGDWSVPTNWDPCGVPGCDDWVWVANGGTAGITGTAECAYAVYVESSGVSVLSGSLGVGDLLMLDYGGFCELSGTGELTTRYTAVSGAGSASFIHTGGVHTVTEGIWIGDDPTAVGTYELSGQGQLIAVYEDWPYSGTGVFRQFGGTNTVGNTMIVAHEVGSNGTYELSAGANLYAPLEVIGQFGNGTFIQTGGTNLVENLEVGGLVGSDGTYELSGDANLYAPWEVVGRFGNGTFIQTGGTDTVANDLVIGQHVGSDGQYQLLGGTLNVGNCILVGVEGTGSFVVDGGAINGTTENAELFCSNIGTLTGPGTFNITVTYESDEIYGTYGDESVAATFDPCCLTVGGAYDVDWTTPENFAGGTVPNLLESSVFDVNFDGVYCGQFELAIPYNQSEVNVCDANELELLVLRETGPETYEQIPIVEIDTYDDVIYAYCNSFGKYAVQVAECNGGGGLCCVPWYLGDLDHDCDVSLDDLYELADSWLQDDPSVDIFPIGGDGIANFADFTVLANHWLECIVP